MAHRTNKPAVFRTQYEISSIFPDYAAYAHDLCMLRSLQSMGLKASVIYDIGASDGVWSYVASRVFPDAKFEMFEPLASECRYFHSRAAHQGLSRFCASANVSMHQVALGKAGGIEGKLAVFPDLVSSTTLPLDYPPEAVEFRRLPLFQLDEYVKKNELPKPDLIKLATQGSELEILQGATRLLCEATAILCECWLFPGYGRFVPLWLEVANFLRQEEFDIFDFGWVYRRPDNQRPATVDILFLKRSKKISPLHVYWRSE